MENWILTREADGIARLVFDIPIDSSTILPLPAGLPSAPSGSARS